MKSWILYAAQLFLTMSLMACSEEDSEKVEMSFSPENPRVQFYDLPLTIYTDSSGDPISETIKAPWFRVKMNVTNGAGKSLVISNLNLTIKGLTPTQGFTTATATISPSALFVNKNEPDVDDTTYLSLVDAGASKSIPDPQAVTNANWQYLYIGDLPAEVLTGVYNIEVEAIGWFGAVDAPSGVFRQKYFFTTD